MRNGTNRSVGFFQAARAAILILAGIGLLAGTPPASGQQGDPAGDLPAYQITSGERVVSHLLERLESVEGIRDLDDAAFADTVLEEFRVVLGAMADEPLGSLESVQEFEVLYAVSRYFQRRELARELLLGERRRTTDPSVQNWIFTELLELNRQQLLSQAGYRLPDSAAQEIEPGQAGVTAQYSLGHSGTMFAPPAADLKTQAVILRAQGYEGDAARLLQMGNKNAAVRMIDLAAQAYSGLHGKSEFAFGPLVWAARYVRDLGLPLAAIIRFKLILDRLGEANTSWRGIVQEDLAGLYRQLGQFERAARHYEQAAVAYEVGNNPEGMLRVENKRAELDR